MFSSLLWFIWGRGCYLIWAWDFMAYCSGSLGSFPCQIWMFNFTLLPRWGHLAKGSSKVQAPALRWKGWWQRHPPWPLWAKPDPEPQKKKLGNKVRVLLCPPGTETQGGQEVSVVWRWWAAGSQAPPQGDATAWDRLSHQSRAAVGQGVFPSIPRWLLWAKGASPAYPDGCWSPWQGCCGRGELPQDTQMAAGAPGRAAARFALQTSIWMSFSPIRWWTYPLPWSHSAASSFFLLPGRYRPDTWPLAPPFALTAALQHALLQLSSAVARSKDLPVGNSFFARAQRICSHLQGTAQDLVAAVLPRLPTSPSLQQCGEGAGLQPTAPSHHAAGCCLHGPRGTLLRTSAPLP